MLLFVLSLCGFATAMSARLVDPVVIDIAADLGAPIAFVALLSTAYALPFAMTQPLIGPFGDIFAKARIIKVAIVVLAILLAAAGAAPGLSFLFTARVLAGVASAAILPIGFALIGDVFPMSQRQVAISRFLAASLIGQLVGASASGALSAAMNWRVVFYASAALTGIVALAALWRLPEKKPEQVVPFRISTAVHNYASVLRNPRAIVCFGTVLVEGAIIYGWLPYLGDFLRSLGKGGVREAGLTISGQAIGGILYTLNVPLFVRVLERCQMMLLGGAIAACGLLLASIGASWPIEFGIMGIVGFGFFMLHNPIQTEVSELAPEARASAFALHAFSFYIGQALGPVLYGLGAHTIGLPASLWIGSAGFLAVGFCAYRLLKTPPETRNIAV
jgi:predicted MFS family arabinose efflux permease